VNFAPLGGSAPLRAIIAALRKNEVVLITGDRAIVGESVERDFFGARTRLPSGPISLALRTGAMVVGAVGWYKRRGRIGGHFTPISLAMPEEERVNEERLHTKVVEMMEREIRCHPEQWLVFAPVWED
ncbi:MAG TPA: hypothetical protein VGT44_19190, partial [Ktedonobacteraceae bacterium]|nr:hypothetical protein [Ktedonobacteraceae bacterium]